MGFIMLRLARVVRQKLLSISVRFQVQPLKAFSAFGSFSPFVGHFFKRAREREVKLRHIVYEV